MLLSGRARMVTGDWAEWPDRDRAFEIWSMLPGDIVLIKGGQLHALLDTLDGTSRCSCSAATTEAPAVFRS